MKLPLIPQDKANHIVYGLIIYILSTLFFSNFISLIIVIIAAVLKETIDYKNKGNVETLDALATISSGLILFLKDLLF